MSAIKRWYIGVFGGEAQARPCSPAEFEIIHSLDGRYFVLDEDFDRVTAERDALQERLNAADQRADDLETQLAATEQSRRAWFDSSQAADKQIDDLEQGHGLQVAYVLTRDGEVCYEADDGIVISNTPGDETDLYKWRPVYFGITGSPAEVAQKLIKQLTDEYSDPDTLLTVECIGDLITEYLTYPQ